jgi:hypothetical protein
MKFEATIVGLPRSRTYWFSRLLSHGDAHCFHEFDNYKYPIPIRKRLFNSSFTPWLPHEGKILVIERDRAEAQASFLKFVAKPDLMLVESIFDAGELSLDIMDAGLRIDYNDVNGRLPEILDYMGIDLPEHRISSFLNKELNSPDTSESESRFAYA